MNNLPSTVIDQLFLPITGKLITMLAKNPKVSSLMTGVFNERPPKPKYVFIWDVEQVLSYIKQPPPVIEFKGFPGNKSFVSLTA